MDSSGATSLSVAIEHHETSLLSRLPQSPRSNGHPHRHSNPYYDYKNPCGNDDFLTGNGDDFDENSVDFLFTYATAQKLFDSISSKDESTRRNGLHILHEVIIRWAKYKSCLKRRSFTQVRFENDSVDQDFTQETNEALICPMQQAIANLFRMSVQCPFSDVRKTCQDILVELKVIALLLLLYCGDLTVQT